MTTTEFRSKLHQITDKTKPSTHAELVTALNREYPHRINLVKDAVTLLANCHMYSLDLVDAAEVIKLLKTDESLSVGTKYMEELIKTGLLSEDDNGPIIVYFKDGALTHSGKAVGDDIAESKWGLGNVWRHGILEVPLEYGDEYKLLRPASQDDLIDAFKKYAQSKRS